MMTLCTQPQQRSFALSGRWASYRAVQVSDHGGGIIHQVGAFVDHGTATSSLASQHEAGRTEANGSVPIMTSVTSGSERSGNSAWLPTKRAPTSLSR